MTSTITYNGRTIPITDQHGRPIELIQGETFYMAQDGSSAMVMRGNRKTTPRREGLKWQSMIGHVRRRNALKAFTRTPAHTRPVGEGRHEIAQKLSAANELIEALIDMLENGDARSRQMARAALRKAGVTV